MQLHYGCRRNNNTRMFHKLGRDTGYDAVLQGTPSLEVAAFLDLLASQDALPRMVLYSLNPNDDEGLKFCHWLLPGRHAPGPHPAGLRLVV